MVNANFKTLSLPAPRNWVQKNGAKRRWRNNENWLDSLIREFSYRRVRGQPAPRRVRRTLPGLSGPVFDIALQHAILEALLFEHGLGDVVKRNHAQHRIAIHYRKITRMMLKHGAPQFI